MHSYLRKKKESTEKNALATAWNPNRPTKSKATDGFPAKKWKQNKLKHVGYVCRRTIHLKSKTVTQAEFKGHPTLVICM